MTLALLAGRLNLGEVLDTVRVAFGGYELLAHWTQGEFHHDLVLRVAEPKSLPGPVLVISTNCNGGVKEALCLRDEPERDALWHERCPTGEFAPVELPVILDRIRTMHYFDPCELLTVDARSELKPEFRRRQRGGGWEPTY